jgi:methyl-accepting chemotaxis protein
MGGSAGMKSRFSDMRVGRKLALLIGTGAMALGIVGFTGVRSLASVSTSAGQIYEQGALPLQELASLRNRTSNMRLLLMKHGLALNVEQMDALEREFDETDASVDEALDTYRSTTDMDSIRDDLASEYEAALASWREIRREQFLPASRRSDAVGLNTILDEALNEQGQAMADSLTALFRIESEDAGVRAEAAAAAYHAGRNLMVIVIAAGLAAMVALGVVITRGITRPLMQAKAVIDRLAQRDLRGRVNASAHDEIGQMSRALDQAIDELSQAVHSIGSSSDTLSSASVELSAVATQLAGGAEEVSEQAQSVSASSEQVSHNIATVASGAEEMGASIEDIARNAGEAASVAGEAVGLAQRTSDVVHELESASVEIGDVVRMISSIAEQTNLLALNATIEAARAGEAGKGFAVVANEVKELAQETGRATAQISQKVSAIQSSAEGVVSSIAQVAAIIERVSGFQASIASAVEEQAATTTEIGRSVAEASIGTSSIASSVTAVATAANQTATGAQSAEQAATDLSRLANELQGLVARFQLV